MRCSRAGWDRRASDKTIVMSNELSSSAEVWRRGAVGRDSPGWQIHLRDFAVLGERELAVFRLERVDVHRAI